MFAHHLLKDSQMFLMLECHTSQQRVIIRSVLIVLVVSHKYSLDLFHIVFLVHLEGAAIDNFCQSGFVRSRKVLVVIQKLVYLI